MAIYAVIITGRDAKFRYVMVYYFTFKYKIYSFNEKLITCRGLTN